MATTTRVRDGSFGRSSELSITPSEAPFKAAPEGFPRLYSDWHPARPVPRHPGSSLPGKSRWASGSLGAAGSAAPGRSVSADRRRPLRERRDKAPRPWDRRGGRARSLRRRCGQGRARSRGARARGPACAFCSTIRMRHAGSIDGDDLLEHHVDEAGARPGGRLVEQQDLRARASARAPSRASAARRPRGCPPAGGAARQPWEEPVDDVQRRRSARPGAASGRSRGSPRPTASRRRCSRCGT